MKENLGHLLFLATALFLASFLQNVVSYPMQPESNEANLIQPNSEILKDPQGYIPQSNLDARY